MDGSLRRVLIKRDLLLSLACCSPWGCKVRHDLATEQQRQYLIIIDPSLPNEIVSSSGFSNATLCSCVFVVFSSFTVYLFSPFCWRFHLPDFYRVGCSLTHNSEYSWELLTIHGLEGYLVVHPMPISLLNAN